MNKDSLIDNLTEQIKEAQLKLGYAEETIRLYFPVRSMCALLQIEAKSGQELVALLKEEKGFDETVLGKVHFTLCRDERIEVCIPVAGAVYVYEQVPNPPFLESVIELFRNNHNLTIEELCECFAKFSEHYQCNKMEPGTGFDYVLFFPDHNPDSWYYCIKMEMEHTIYHRFTEADYYSFVS
ncbi:MAG: DUF3877 family protein [Lachnospiraceae bacterium]|nr:DUF3877 family protein [Lachnospiraceae bacterium]